MKSSFYEDLDDEEKRLAKSKSVKLKAIKAYSKMEKFEECRKA